MTVGKNKHDRRPLQSAVAAWRTVAGGVSGNLGKFLALLLVCLLAMTFAWKRWGGMAIQQPGYVVGNDQLVVTPQPTWIPADIKADVIRDGQLKSLSLLDPQATLKVARAFNGHPWVLGVRRVSKRYPAQIVVDLEYRRPVAWVEVKDDKDEPGLFPVDATGALLPPQELEPLKRELLRVSVGETYPKSDLAGKEWGDDRVHGAALIAAALADHWKRLELYRIVLIPTDSPKKMPDLTYELLTRDQRKIHWGHTPGHERPNEPPAVDKVARLIKFVEEHGPLSSGDASSIDLRERSGITTAPPTARQPRSLPR